MKIVLIRHGKTQGNMKKQYVGSTDENLTHVGVEEIKRLIKTGVYPSVDLVWSSPMIRAKQTAELIYPNKKIEIVDAVKECNFGSFEGKNYQQLKNKPEYRQWIDSRGKTSYHGGESFCAFTNRCFDGFLSIVNSKYLTDQSTLAIVCHGGVIMSILSEISHPQKDFYSWQVKNAKGYIFDFLKDKKLAYNVKEF